MASSETADRKAGGETRRHRKLKDLACAWLRETERCGAVATEVRLPLSPYRVDVAGYRSVGRLGVAGETFAIECKQSRADFLRDAGIERAVARERGSVVEEVEALRALLSAHLPDCRQGLSLFREYDEYDFGDLRHERWRRLVARLALLERRLADGVKFSRMTRYGVASCCYLAVERGVLSDAGECPAGWGLLERCEGDRLTVLKRANRLASKPAAKLAYLERIASRASYTASRKV